MKCLKCQWSPLHPMRPRRHHAKCPLRGIGTARRRTSALFRRAWQVLCDVRQDTDRFSLDRWTGEHRLRAARDDFAERCGRGPRELRWYIHHRAGGSVNALFERVDLSSPRFGLRPLTPLPPIRRLILSRPGAFSGPPVLVLSSEWALYRAPPWATSPVLAVQRPRLDPVLLTPGSMREAEPVRAAIDQYQLHQFKSGEGESFRVYLPLGQDPTDEIAATIEPLVALLDLARVPGMTERAMGEFAFQRFGWFRASVEWRVREIRAWSLRESLFCEHERRERDRAYRCAVECECAELIAGARALLAEGAGQ